MFNLFLLCCATAYILEVWLNTNSFVEYMCLARCSNLFYIDDYLKVKKDGYTENYAGFLKEYFDCFFVRLITCATCLSFWFGLLGSIFLAYCYWNILDLLLIFPIAFLNLFFYRVLGRLA